MRAVVTIQHPAHVHFFKHAITELEREGHDVHVVARDKEIAVNLLDRCEIDHTVLAGTAGSLPRLAAVQFAYEARLLRYARRVEPDVITGIGGVAAAHVAPLVDAESIVFTDTEHATIINQLSHPVADVVCTPSCYRDDVGRKQVQYPGYHELAYLHPDRFTPDPAVFDDVDARRDETLAVVRLNGWDSSHDVGASGFDDPVDAVERLEEAGARALVTSEVPLPDEIERCRTTVPSHQIHHLLAYADLFVGEGATMAAECAVLGTPAVYVNSLTMGYTDELDEEYGLVFNTPDDGRHDAALERAVEVVDAAGDGRWERRRESLLADKRDTTNVVLRMIRHAAGSRPARAGPAGDEDAPIIDR